MSTGLTGRHSHVFDLVDAGYRKASQVAVAGGMGRDAARDALKILVDIGLLEKVGTVYTVPTDALETANRLAVERGGSARRARLIARIDEERARPRGDAPKDPITVLQIDLDDEERRRRDEHDELMRQLGML